MIWKIVYYSEAPGSRTRSDGTLYTDFTLRAQGNLEWRITQDFVGSNRQVKFLDLVRNQDLAWKLMPTWLVLVNSNYIEPINGHPILEEGKAVFDRVRLSSNFSFPFIVSRGFGSPVIELSPLGQWNCIFNSQTTPDLYQMNGTWDSVEEAWVVDSLQLLKNNKEVLLWEFEQWKYDTNTGLHVANKVRVFNSDNTLVESILTQSIVIEDADSFQPYIRTPNFGQHDTRRDLSSLLTITDFRGAVGVDLVIGTDGLIHEFRHDELNELREDAKSDVALSSQFLCAAVVFLLVGLWIRKHSN